MKKISYLFLLMLLTIVSCRQDSEQDKIVKIPIGPETNFEQLVYGKVVSETGEAISNAEVKADGQTLTTDNNGLFLFKEIYAGNYGTQFSASKSGYLYGGFRLYAGEVGTNQVEIVLVEAKNLGSVTSGIGGEVQIASYTSVNFPADAFTLDGTTVYNGNVNVFGNWIDPSAENMLELIPGDLSGINQTNDRVILNSYGMVGVELRTDAGEELQIIDGKEAELSFEIPNKFLADAPSTIPLWSFDENEGIWIEEGSADLIGNQYIGNVKHFTWWNCDLPNAILPFCITIVHPESGLPMPNVYVTFNNTAGFGFAAGNTNERGLLCGFLPENMEMEVNISLSTSNCINIGSGPTIGPFTTADLPIAITLALDAGPQIVISDIMGTITDCTTNQVVPNAFVEFSWGTDAVSAISDSNGNYTQNLISCDPIANLDIKAISIDLVKEETKELTNVDGGSTTLDIALCDDFIVSSWFVATAGGFIEFSDVEARVKTFETQILVGDNTVVELLGFDCQSGNCQGSYVGQAGAFNVDVEVLNFGAIGQTIEGTFSGTDNTGDAVTGSFVAKRTE